MEFYTEEDFHTLTRKFEHFCLNNDIKILHTFYCPHHKDGIIKRYSKDCENRKPNSGMFLKAAKLYNINLEKAIMVGDNITDIIASTNAGIKINYLIKLHLTKEDLNKKITFIVKENLLSVTNEICKCF